MEGVAGPRVPAHPPLPGSAPASCPSPPSLLFLGRLFLGGHSTGGRARSTHATTPAVDAPRRLTPLRCRLSRCQPRRHQLPSPHRRSPRRSRPVPPIAPPCPRPLAWPPSSHAQWPPTTPSLAPEGGRATPAGPRRRRRKGGEGEASDRRSPAGSGCLGPGGAGGRGAVSWQHLFPLPSSLYRLHPYSYTRSRANFGSAARTWTPAGISVDVRHLVCAQLCPLILLFSRDPPTPCDPLLNAPAPARIRRSTRPPSSYNISGLPPSPRSVSDLPFLYTSVRPPLGSIRLTCTNVDPAVDAAAMAEPSKPRACAGASSPK